MDSAHPPALRAEFGHTRDHASAFSPTATRATPSSSVSVTPPARRRSALGTTEPTSDASVDMSTPVADARHPEPRPAALMYGALAAEMASLLLVALGVDSIAGCAHNVWRINVAFVLVALFILAAVARVTVCVAESVYAYRRATAVELPTSRDSLPHHLARYHHLRYSRHRSGRKFLGFRVRAPYQFVQLCARVTAWMHPFPFIAVVWVIHAHSTHDGSAGDADGECATYEIADAIAALGLLLVSLYAHCVERGVLMANFTWSKHSVLLEVHARRMTK